MSAHPTPPKAEAHEKGGHGAPAKPPGKVMAWIKGDGVGYLKQTGPVLKDVTLGLLSPDRPTRRMSLVFFASLIGVMLVFGMGWNRYRYLKSLQKHEPTHAEIEARKQQEVLEKKAEEDRRKHTVLKLGTFNVELRRDPKILQSRSSMHMAELEITIECDVPETCAFIKDALPVAKNQLTGVFGESDRDELMSREGKRRLRRALQEKLNLWLPKGKIENLYISNMIIG